LKTPFWGCKDDGRWGGGQKRKEEKYTKQTYTLNATNEGQRDRARSLGRISKM